MDGITRSPRRGEYPVPSSAKLARCRSCGAEIIWTTTGNNNPMPLSVETIVEDESGRYALNHWADCPHAPGKSKGHAAERRLPFGSSGSSLHDGKIEFPLTMAFPPGAFVPVFCARSYTWPDGTLSVTFADRWQLEEDVFVSRLARELGLTGRVVERGDVMRVEMT